MKIAIDATTFMINRAGVTSYLQGLLEGFRNIPNVVPITCTTGRPAYKQGKAERKLTTLYRELIWQPMLLPVRAKKMGCDLLFSPSHVVATKASLPRFVTFHDFYILRRPDAFTPWHATMARRQYPRIMASAPHVIVISEFSRHELYHFYPDFKGTVEVIYNGISSVWKPIADKEYVQGQLAKFNLPGAFVFAVGSLEPRKNFSALFQIWQQSSKDELPPLVLVMPDAWASQSAAEQINKLVADKKLIILKNIERAELACLYNSALCLVYPSLYEGFGIPPMEAMACGCPVITSDNSALKEIYKSTAVMINPNDAEAIKQAIKDVVGNSALRQQLADKGMVMAQDFTFSKMARQTIRYFADYAG